MAYCETGLMHCAQIFLDERIRMTTARWKEGGGGVFFFEHDEAEKGVLCPVGLTRAECNHLTIV